MAKKTLKNEQDSPWKEFLELFRILDWLVTLSDDLLAQFQVGLDCAIVAPDAHFPHPVGRGKRLLSSDTLEEVFGES